MSKDAGYSPYFKRSEKANYHKDLVIMPHIAELRGYHLQNSTVGAAASVQCSFLEVLPQPTLYVLVALARFWRH